MSTKHVIQHDMHFLTETAAIGLSVITAAAAKLLFVADASGEPSTQFALHWFLLPLIGAMSASVCSMLFNPNVEGRRIVAARCIFGVVLGCAIPKVVSMFHPKFNELALDPAVAFLAGFLVCMVFYALSKPLVEKLFARSSDLTDKLDAEAQKWVKTKKLDQ